MKHKHHFVMPTIKRNQDTDAWKISSLDVAVDCTIVHTYSTYKHKLCTHFPLNDICVYQLLF